MHTKSARRKWPVLPYPGLRPFEITEEIDESLIFFGRQNQVFELIDRLGESHLVAVIGPSGCGKSSLVRVGLIPSLESGYLYRAGSRWVTTIMEPGSHPIQALSVALSDAVAKADTANDSKNKQITASEFKERLQIQPDALVEFNDEIASIFGERTNLLILVDQFEELFRPDLASPREALDLINLILNVFNARPDRLYIVITMRTDCLEQCAYYRGLPEALNQTHYLPPRLNDEELREAIIKPAELEKYDGSIEPALLRQLLYEMSDEVAYDPDYLPLMQHALAWMWQTSKDNIGEDQGRPALKMTDYENFDGLADNLSEHANRIFNNLSVDQQKIAEVMFRLMSDLGHGGRISRRVTSPARIAAVAGVSIEEVAPVIDAFTDKNNCFVRWKDNRTKLDVTHESLIRKWDMLEKWVRDEAKSAEIYRKLEMTALSWKEKKANLLTGPEFENALEWEKNEKPTAQWAQRYGDDFKIVEEFLYKSKKKKLKRRFRNFTLLILGNLLLLASLLGGLWIGWRYSSEGKLQQIQNDYARLIQKEKNIPDEKLRQIAKVFAQWDELADAKLILMQIHDTDKRTRAIEEVSYVFAKAGELKTAAKVTEMISDLRRKATALHNVVTTLSSTEKFESALAIGSIIQDQDIKGQAFAKVGEDLCKVRKVKDALRVADKMVDPERKSMVLERVALALVQIDRVDEAQRVADNILNLEVKEPVLVNIVNALVRQGRIEEAQRVAGGIHNPDEKARAHGVLAANLAKAGDFDKARRMAGAISDQAAWAKAIGNITEELAKAGNFDKAYKMARGISNSKIRNKALGEIAVALIQAGKVKDALKVADIITDQQAKDTVLKDVAKALIRSGKVQEALHVADMISNPQQKTWVLNIAAGALAKADKVEEGKRVIEGMPDPDGKGRAIQDFAVALIQAGKVEDARQAADMLSDSKKKTWVLNIVAGALAKAGKVDEAKRVIEGMPDPDGKGQAIEDFAVELVQAGKVEDARRVVEGVSDPTAKNWALRRMAVALGRLGRVEAAKQVAEGISDSEAKTWVLRIVAMDLAEAGKIYKARQVANSIQESEAKSTILKGVVEILIQAGKVEMLGEVTDAIPDQAVKAKGLRLVAEALVNARDFTRAQAVANSISDPNARTGAIGDVAVALVKVGNEKDIRKVVEMIVDNVGKDFRDEVLGRVAEAFAQKRQLWHATDIAQYISDSSNKLNTYSSIFIIYYTD